MRTIPIERSGNSGRASNRQTKIVAASHERQYYTSNEAEQTSNEEEQARQGRLQELDTDVDATLDEIDSVLGEVTA